MAGLRAALANGNWRRWRPLALIGAGGLVAIVAVAVVVGARSSGSASAQGSLGPLAGYVWEGHATAVHATWTVPRIESSKQGQAGTWIGAQDLAAAPNGAFIQVGTNEIRIPEPIRVGDVNRHVTTDQYFAFWSDTQQHFHPRFLFEVFPGDKVSATMRLEPAGWKVSIVDDDLSGPNSKASFTTRQETGGDFDSALWLQEDITDARTQQPGPYPDLSTVHFAQLTVNGHQPPYAKVYSQWMSSGLKSGLAPTPLSGDAFSLHDQTLNAQAAHYLDITRAANAAQNRFTKQLASWSLRTPPSQIRSQCSAAAAAVRSVDMGLQSHRWPPAVEGAVARLARDGETEYRLLLAPPASTGAALPRWRAAFTRAATTIGATAHVVRRELGAPELTPYGQ